MMLQELLKQLFGLRVHHETREIPVCALVTGKNDLKLAVATKNPEPGHCGINIESGMLIARSGTIDDFVDVLTTNLDRPVLNRTERKRWSVGAVRTGSSHRAKAPIDMLVVDVVNPPAEQ